MKGDHRVFVKKGARRPIVVPGRLSGDLPEGTLKIRSKGIGAKIAPTFFDNYNYWKYQ